MCSPYYFLKCQNYRNGEHDSGWQGCGGWEGTGCGSTMTTQESLK